jgi:hypothetical protein
MAATKTAPANTAPVNTPAGAPDATGWIKEETGFAPYWSPEAKKFFFAKCVGRDERDPEFVRYLMECAQDELPCKSGPKEESVDITVRNGDKFTISVYTQLDNLFNEFMESGLFPIMRCEAVKEVKTKTPGQTCWIFDVRVSPEDRKQLSGYRAEKAQLMAQTRSERAAIQQG